MIEPNPASKCRDCFFFDDGACTRFRTVSELHFGGKDEDVVVLDCGGYETVNPPHDTTDDALSAE